MACPRHRVPGFGCQDCIRVDKVRILEQAKVTTPPPPCPECKGRMEIYEADERTMMIYYVCAAGLNRHGELICDGEVEVEVRR